MENVEQTEQVTTGIPPEGQQPQTEQAAQQGQEADQQKPEQAEQETEEKKQSRAARRWNRMRDRAIAAETEAKLLREQLSRGQPAPQAQAKPTDGEPTREQFDSYEAYIEAKATYRAEKAAEARVAKALEERSKRDEEGRSRSQAEKQAVEFQKHIEAARDDIEDFDEVMQEAEATVTHAMAEAIRESGAKGPLIAYHLAKNPEEAERISKLSPTRQAAEIVKLEEKVTKPAKSPSKAPPPINPINKPTGAGKTVSTLDPKAAETLDPSEWIRLERARVAALHR